MHVSARAMLTCPKIVDSYSVGKVLRSVTHLGHILTSKLQDDQDIERCLLDFVKRANSTLYRFKFCTPRVLAHLLRSSVTSLYGCAIWSLNTRSIRSKIFVVFGPYLLIVTLIFFTLSLIVHSMFITVVAVS